MWATFLAAAGALCTPGAWAGAQDLHKFLIASFPDLKEVGYLKLPETAWRPLIGSDVSDLVSPKALATDNENQRLFVADPPVQKIYWYNIVHKSDGRITSDMKQHVAVNNVTAYSMKVDTIGNLYFSGKKTVAPPKTSSECVFRLDAVKIAMGQPQEAKEVWTQENTGLPTPGVWMPSGIAVDAFSVFWANSEKGTTNGAIVKGTGLSRAKSSMLFVTKLVDNQDQVNQLVMTPTSVFYTTPTGIYAIAKNKMGVSCGVNDVECPTISTEATDVQGLAFDGDGTVYVSDNSLGSVYSFPSGSRAAHKLKHLTNAPGTWGLAVLAYDKTFKEYSAGSRRKAAGLGLAAAVAVAARAII